MQRAEETGPSRLWIPDAVGFRLQEGVPPCNSGMAQKDHLQEIFNPNKLSTMEGSDRSRNKDYTLCRAQAYG
jgi:hypothetical protein